MLFVLSRQSKVQPRMGLVGVTWSVDQDFQKFYGYRRWRSRRECRQYQRYGKPQTLDRLEEWMKENQFLTSLMTSSVRKASLTIELVVWQDTLMSTKRTRMSLWCGDSSMVALHLEARCRLVMTEEFSPMMMTHTGNTSNLQCQEVGRRKGAKELVVVWAYSVVLVWLVWFVSKRFVNEIIMIIIKHLKKLDYQRAW